MPSVTGGEATIGIRSVRVGAPQVTMATVAIDARLEAWRRALRESGGAYEAWSAAPATRRAEAFAVYVAARDREEAAERWALSATGQSAARLV